MSFAQMHWILHHRVQETGQAHSQRIKQYQQVSSEESLHSLYQVHHFLSFVPSLYAFQIILIVSNQNLSCDWWMTPSTQLFQPPCKTLLGSSCEEREPVFSILGVHSCLMVFIPLPSLSLSLPSERHVKAFACMAGGDRVRGQQMPPNQILFFWGRLRTFQSRGVCDVTVIND